MTKSPLEPVSGWFAHRLCLSCVDAARSSLQQPPAADSPAAAPDTFPSDAAGRHIPALTLVLTTFCCLANLGAPEHMIIRSDKQQLTLAPEAAHESGNVKINIHGARAGRQVVFFFTFLLQGNRCLRLFLLIQQRVLSVLL